MDLGACRRKQLPKDFKNENIVYQEYFIFEVFSENGILLTEVPLPDEIERFDNLTMFKDHIYFVDPYGQACVYKYRVVRK